MGTERTDLAKSIRDDFNKSLQSLATAGTNYDEYRSFIIRFWPDEEDREFGLDAVTLAEMAGENLGDWHPFQVFFKWKSCREFSKYITQFRDEDIKLGFMSR